MEKLGILMAEKDAVQLSDKENGLLERFKVEKTILLENMNAQEKGALGKLAARKLVEKVTNTAPLDGKQPKRVWKLVGTKDEGTVVESASPEPTQ